MSRGLLVTFALSVSIASVDAATISPGDLVRVIDPAYNGGNPATLDQLVEFNELSTLPIDLSADARAISSYGDSPAGVFQITSDISVLITGGSTVEAGDLVRAIDPAHNGGGSAQIDLLVDFSELSTLPINLSTDARAISSYGNSPAGVFQITSDISVATSSGTAGLGDLIRVIDPAHNGGAGAILDLILDFSEVSTLPIDLSSDARAISSYGDSPAGVWEIISDISVPTSGNVMAGIGDMVRITDPAHLGGSPARLDLLFDFSEAATLPIDLSTGARAISSYGDSPAAVYQVIPIPPALWLFGSALCLLGLWRSKC